MGIKSDSTNDTKFKLKYSLRQYPWKFMGYIILSLAIPRLYSLTSTFWIGQIDYSSLSIAEQYEFMGILIEIVNETIPFGVLALVSQNYKKQEMVKKQVSTAILLQLLLSSVLSIVILVNMPSFVNFIGTSQELVDRTITYLSLRAIALPFNSVALLLIISLKSMDKARLGLEIVAINVLINMLLDLFLVSDFNFSLQLGLSGVAIGYLISNIIYCALAVIGVIYAFSLQKPKIKSEYLKEESIDLFKVGGWTGLDSLIRNVFYFFILQALNYLGPNQFAGFQLFQKIMWTVLIPVIAISQGTSIRVGNYLKEEHAREKILNILKTSSFLGFLIVGVFGILGLLFIDAFGAVFTSNPKVIYYSGIMFFWQIIPYILFAIAM
ncbi:MAG: hypothetical protein GF311_12855, partial [Candidatus Lokiarchaeota archaeon]|nr:hypothetical protein [Candidatus Lokiarchaeota archaeon]